jgi:hypothetical protein
MSRLDAERLAMLYEGFYAEHDSKEALPRFLNSPPIQDRDHFHTSPLEFVAGCAVLALVAVVFGWVL